jgi:hypothetical protein
LRAGRGVRDTWGTRAGCDAYRSGMLDPSDEDVERGSAALVPFVHRWGLSLNPEDLALMAYAVLRHAGGSSDWEALDADVHQLIDWQAAAKAGLYKPVENPPVSEPP